MYTWGDNKYSKVFCNEHVNIVNLPWQVQCKEKFAHVACGLYFNMAITNNGKIYSWGINDYGQLGIGHCQEKKNPCIITSLEDITIGNEIFSTKLYKNIKHINANMLFNNH